jgi:hypothetical protein
MEMSVTMKSNSAIQRLKALICLSLKLKHTGAATTAATGGAVDEAPAVYVAAQQALYEHQQQRQVLIEQYNNRRKGILIKLLNIAFTTHYRAI